jgi:hypothetical protein
MADTPITLQAIEEAVLAFLQAHWPSGAGETKVAVFDIAKDFEDILATPALSVAIERVGWRKMVGLDSGYELAPETSIYLVNKNVGGPKGRRQGVYPMVLGAAGILVGQELGLDIDPLMPVGAIEEIFHDNLKKIGCCAFKVGLRTSFDISMSDFGAAGSQLLTSGVEYYRLPAGEEADMEDEITVGEEA